MLSPDCMLDRWSWTEREEFGFLTFNRLDCINPYDMKVVHVTNSGVVNYLTWHDSKGNIWVGDNSSVKCYYAAGEIKGSNFGSKGVEDRVQGKYHV